MKIDTRRITKDHLTVNDIKENEYFVFGSNLSGIHGAGAAKFAHKELGARWGVGEGLTGKTYALPTVSHGIRRPLNIDEINEFVNNFINFAKSNPKKFFYVTEVGCGLAGLTYSEIAPLFKDVVNLENVSLPLNFWKYLR